MTEWIHLDESIKGRVNAIRKENERLIKLLMQMGVLRESMIPGWHVIYTEMGAIDIHLDKLKPCIKLYAVKGYTCECKDCAGLCGCGCGDLQGEQTHG